MHARLRELPILLLLFSFGLPGGCGSGQAPRTETAGPDDPPPLPFSYVRPDPSPPLSEQELARFSRALRNFFAEVSYADWLLRTSHGMDASTGMREYRLWWEEIHAVKQGDTVRIRHDHSPEHGGHNILRDNAMVLGAGVAGHMKTGDPVFGELARQLCRGLSANMLGMVHDANDPVKHLMARNVVTSNHVYQTHDGRRKAVDYSNWFHPYDRWNCSRFLYENNPYWGEVWVTNTRSKDGMGYLFRAAVSARHAAERAPDPEVRAACGETWDLLTLFARDIVEHGYLIRSKDRQGRPYRPGVDPEPAEADVGDLASYKKWDLLFPGAECNSTRATAFMAHGDPLDNDCSPFGGNRIYEFGALVNNPPNGHVKRSLHIAGIAQALHHGDYRTARQSLEGLEQRFARDLNIDLDIVGPPPDRWFRDIAVSLMQSASVGYYLTHDEIRMIHDYTYRALEAYRAWDYWDLWADGVPENTPLEVIPPSDGTLPDGTRRWWWKAVDLSLFIEYCWGLNRNPAGPRVVDCGTLGF